MEIVRRIYAAWTDGPRVESALVIRTTHGPGAG